MTLCDRGLAGGSARFFDDQSSSGVKVPFQRLAFAIWLSLPVTMMFPEFPTHALYLLSFLCTQYALAFALVAF